MIRAEEAALKAYPDKEMNGVALLFHEQRRLFQEGYEQAEKDLIGRLVEFYPTLDYTFRGYMLQAFPELKGKIEHYD